MSNDSINNSYPSSSPTTPLEKKGGTKLPVVGIITLIAAPIAIGGGLAAIEFLLIGPGTLAYLFSAIALPILMTPPGLLIAGAAAITLGLTAIIFAIVLATRSRQSEKLDDPQKIDESDDSSIEVVFQEPIENIPLNELLEQKIQFDEDGYPTDDTCRFITEQVMVMGHKDVKELALTLENVEEMCKKRALLNADNALVWMLKSVSQEAFIKRIFDIEGLSPINEECANIIRGYQEEENRIQLLKELEVSGDDDLSISSTEEESSISTEAIYESEVNNDSLIITENQWRAQEAITRPFALLHLLSFLMPRDKKEQIKREKSIEALVDMDTDSILLKPFYTLCNDIYEAQYKEDPVKNSIASIFQETFDRDNLGGSLINFLTHLAGSLQMGSYNPLKPQDLNQLTTEELYTEISFETLLFNSLFDHFFVVAELPKKDLNKWIKTLEQQINTPNLDQDTIDLLEQQLDQYNVLTNVDAIPTKTLFTVLDGCAFAGGVPKFVIKYMEKMFPKTMRKDDAFPLFKKVVIEDSLIPYLLSNGSKRTQLQNIIEGLQSYKGSKEERKVGVRETILTNTRELFTNVITGFIQQLEQASPDELKATIEAALTD